MTPRVPRSNPSPDDPDDRLTGLPGLSSWRRVYLGVGAIFLLWVALLTLLTRAFS
jgi:hypothetical protein